MNSLEWAIRGGIPYAIDFCNQVPDARPSVVTDFYYRWMVDRLSDVCIEYAIDPPSSAGWQSVRRLRGVRS
jgi:hypothetical protein